MDLATKEQYGPWECKTCGETSDQCYRCTECGADLTTDQLSEKTK